MKRLMITIIMVSAFFMMMVPGASAYQITINQNSYSYSNGGEFAVVSGDLSWIGSAYTGYMTKGVQAGAFNFETFCLEYNETFSPGTPSYYTEINPNRAAIIGGLGATAGSDVISKGTAWLYQEFITGHLTKYNYGDPGADMSQFASRSAAAGELQLAIWMLEDEVPYDSNNFYIQQAVGQFGNDVKSNSTAGQGVSVLNVWENSDHIGLHQDQLIGFPVPEPTSILLLSLGLLGLGLSSRKFKK